jgi:DNA polymerase III delta subunit
MQALLTPSFLGGAKTVYLRDAAIFNPLTEPGRFEAVKTQTAQLVEMLKAGLPDGVSLVVLTNQINKSTSFYKTFAASGEVHAFDAPEKPKEVQEDFIPAMEQLVKDRGLQMARPVLMALLDRTGYNRRLVENEIEKLAIYAGNRKTVTAADIQLMVAPVRESKFYEFASTFCDGDLDDTLQVLRRMFAQREEPIALLINLQNRLRDMIIMADCLKRGWAVLSGGERFRTLKWDLPPEGEALLSALERDPRKGHPYAVTMQAVQASRFPAGRWFRWFNAAVDTHAAITGGQTQTPEVALETLVIRTLGEFAATRRP